MRFQCPECHGIVAIDDADFGEPVGCGHCGEVVTVPTSRFAPGVMINDFIVRDTLGHGGMGTVYLAHQFSLDRPVALKILMEQFSTNSEFIVDFVKEARAAAALNHPNIVQSYAVGEEDGIYFFAMEYVEGKTLKQLMDAEGSIPVDRALNIIQQVAEALDFAWKQKQLVHRDIKPDNIMLTHRGVAKLADLGLARMAHETLDDDEDLVMGTPQYICPEQLLGQPMDVRGDIYSLGATMFHALTGQFPFDGKNAAEIARKHLQEAMPDPQEINPALPDTVSWVLAKMMAKKIEERYEDAHQLAIDLGYVLKGEKPVGFGSESPSPSSKPRRKTKGKLQTGTNIGAAAAKSSASGGIVAPSSATGRNPAAPKTKSKTRIAVGGKAAGPPRIKVTSQKTGASVIAEAESKKSTGKFTTGSRTAAGATPAAPVAPEKSANMPVILGVSAIFVLLALMIGGGIFFVVAQGAWKVKSPKAAADLYLSQPHVTQEERVDYANITQYFDQADNFAGSSVKLKEGADALNGFLAKYPNSLFSVNPETQTISYSDIYQAPWYAKGKVDPQASQVVGEVRANLVQYQEQLIREERKQMRLEEEDEWKKNDIEAGDAARVAEAQAQIVERLEQRKADIDERYKEFEEIVARKRVMFADEQRDVRFRVLEAGADLDFDRALTLLEEYRKNTINYPPPLKNLIPAAKQQEEGETNQIVLQVLSAFPGMNTNLNPFFEEKKGEYGFRLQLSKFNELIVQDKDFMDSRDEWYDQTAKALGLAKEYLDLFYGDRNAAMVAHRLSPRGRTPKEEVKSISEQGVVVFYFEFNPTTGAKMKQRDDETKPLLSLGSKVLFEMASKAWGAEDVAGLQIRHAVFLMYSAQGRGIEESAEIISNSLHELSDFLNAELVPMQPVIVEVMCLQYKKDIEKLIRNGDVKRARKFYEALRQVYSDSPGFKKVEPSILDLFPDESAGS